MTERTTVRLDQNLLAKARDYARRSGRTLTSLIEEGLQRVLHSGASEGAADYKITTYGGSGYVEGIDPNMLPSDIDKMLQQQDDIERYGDRP